MPDKTDSGGYVGRYTSAEKIKAYLAESKCSIPWEKLVDPDFSEHEKMRKAIDAAEGEIFRALGVPATIIGAKVPG